MNKQKYDILIFQMFVFINVVYNRHSRFRMNGTLFLVCATSGYTVDGIRGRESFWKLDMYYLIYQSFGIRFKV